MSLVGLNYFLFTIASMILPHHAVTLSDIYGTSPIQSVRLSNEVQRLGSLEPNPFRIVCSDTYESGRLFALRGRSLRSTHMQSLSGRHPTLLSSLAQDTMCFANPDESLMLNTSFKLDTVVSAPLKIHQSVYNFLECTDHASVSDAVRDPQCTTPRFLDISFLTSETMHTEFIGIVQRLSATNFSHTSAFVWTSPFSITALQMTSIDENSSTIDRFDGADADRQRFATWSGLSSTLERLYFDKSDPCSFLSINAIYRESMISLPLDQWATNENPVLADACLAHIVSAAAQMSSVSFIALTPRPTLLNYRSRSIQQSGKPPGYDASTAPYTFQGLLGDGQVISIADTGLDDTSCYFQDDVNGQVPRSSVDSPQTFPNQRKVIQYAVNTNFGDGLDVWGGHGTFVSGTAVGAIASGDILSSLSSDGLYDGIAPNAKIAFVDISTGDTGVNPPPTAAALYGAGYSSGARVHSNSWGSQRLSNGFYASSDLDGYLYSHMDMLVIFAAGNSGGGSADGGTGDGSNSCSVQAQSKNALAVGSSGTTYLSASIENIAHYSSRGPAYDGRIKPDVVAPGDSTTSVQAGGSATGTCDTTDMTGTSMAAPGVGGTALLIRQYFMDPHSKFWSKSCRQDYTFCSMGFPAGPSGVLLKATLLHSGSPMQTFQGTGGSISLTSPPDMFQGYGRVDLKNVLPLYEVYNLFDLFVDDLVSINETATIDYTLTINDTSQPLKVTISWYDPPAQDGIASPALLHNLDLTVTGPGGAPLFYGNGRSSADALNNNEQVFAPSPAMGTWQVSVSANGLPVTGSQLFSIVITCGGFVTAAARE